MPLYDYLCRECGHQFETVVYDPDEQVCCPHCEKSKVERLVSHWGGYAIKGDNSGSTKRKYVPKASKT